MYTTIKGLRIQICIDYNDPDYQWYRPHIDHNADGWLLMGHSKGNGSAFYNLVTAVHIPTNSDTHILIKECSCCLDHSKVYSITHTSPDIHTILAQTRELPDLSMCTSTVHEEYKRIQITPTNAQYMNIYHTTTSETDNYFEYIYRNHINTSGKLYPFDPRTDYSWWPAHFTENTSINLRSIGYKYQFITYPDIVACDLGITTPERLFN